MQKSEIMSYVKKNAFEKELDKKNPSPKPSLLLGNFKKDIEDASKNRLNEEEKKKMMQEFEMQKNKVQEERRLETERNKLRTEFIARQKKRIEEMKSMKSQSKSVSVQRQAPKQSGGLFGLFTKPKIQLPIERKTLPMVVPNLPVLKMPSNQEAVRLKRTADSEIGELDMMLNRLHKLDSDINRLLNESNDVEKKVVSNLRRKVIKRKSGNVRKKESSRIKMKKKVNKKVNVKRKNVSRKRR